MPATADGVPTITLTLPSGVVTTDFERLRVHLSEEVRHAFMLSAAQLSQACSGSPFDPWQEQIQRERLAENNARVLLMSHLSPEQQETYERDRYIDVVGGDTHRKYRIKPGTSFNVSRLDKKGNPDLRLCAGPREILPMDDIMLAQKLWIEHNERQFIKIAHRRAPDGGPYGPERLLIDWLRRYG